MTRILPLRDSDLRSLIGDIATAQSHSHQPFSLEEVRTAHLPEQELEKLVEHGERVHERNRPTRPHTATEFVAWSILPGGFGGFAYGALTQLPYIPGDLDMAKAAVVGAAANAVLMLAPVAYELIQERLRRRKQQYV